MKNARAVNLNLSVLLVEDDAEDIEITRRAFEKGRIANPLYVVRDGEEAIEFLQRRGRYCNPSDAPRPSIILLDLKLPGLDGHEVLRTIRNDDAIARIPVIILTTSDAEADVLACYDEGANTFITKPVGFRKFVEAVITIAEYWLCIAEMPPREAAPAQRKENAS